MYNFVIEIYRNALYIVLFVMISLITFHNKTIVLTSSINSSSMMFVKHILGISDVRHIASYMIHAIVTEGTILASVFFILDTC